MSATHEDPSMLKVALAQSHRLKQCAIAAVTPFRACALAATDAKVSGVSPGMMSCPSFQRAFSHSAALASLGATPHNSSAAGHRPKRKITRAASAAACVPTCAPVEEAVAELIAGVQRGLLAAASCIS